MHVGAEISQAVTGLFAIRDDGADVAIVLFAQ
jgi:hypothetical protein